MPRYLFLAVASCLALFDVSAARAQQAWPTKEVRLVVPFPAGSAADIIARLMSEKLRADWGQAVVVENVPGASGTIGVAKVAKAPPDGHTIVISGDAAVVVAPSLYKSLAYDPPKDLAPVMQIARTPNILVVNKEKGPKSLAELVAWSKAKPSSVTFNSAGYGTSQHIAIEHLQRMAGITVLHAPKNGPTAPEVLGGQVMASFMNVTVALPHIKSGDLLALGASGVDRLAIAPDIPTIAEQGFPGFDAVAWFGLLVPAGTPEAVIAKINAGAKAALAEPQVRERLTQLGVQLVKQDSPAEFAALIKAELPRIAELLKSSGIKLD